MCGIVGVIKDKESTVSREEFNDFLDMLDLAQERGNQATGICYILNTGTCLVKKAPVKSTLITPYIRYFKGIRAIIGHTRWSTGGSPLVNKNNHPHEDKNWVLIHNGLVSLEHSLVKELNCDTDCDTEYFVKMFSYKEEELGTNLKDIFKSAFKEMCGSWSLCFYRKHSGELFLTTNGGSPFKLFKFNDGLYFGSTERYLDSTNKYKESIYSQVEDLEENKVFVYSNKATLEPVCSYTPKVRNYMQTTYNSHNYYGTNNNDWFGFQEEMDETLYGGYKNYTDYYSKPENNPGFQEVNEFLDEKEILENITLGCFYCVYADKVEYAYPFSKEQLQKAALGELLANKEKFELTKEEVLQIRRLKLCSIKNKRTKLPKSVKKKINKQFAEVFHKEYTAEVYMCDNDYFILTNEKNEPCTFVLETFSWYDRLISCIHGLSLGSIEVFEEKDLYITEDVEQEETEEVVGGN